MPSNVPLASVSQAGSSGQQLNVTSYGPEEYLHMVERVCHAKLTGFAMQKWIERNT